MTTIIIILKIITLAIISITGMFGGCYLLHTGWSNSAEENRTPINRLFWLLVGQLGFFMMPGTFFLGQWLTFYFF